MECIDSKMNVCLNKRSTASAPKDEISSSSIHAEFSKKKPHENSILERSFIKIMYKPFKLYGVLICCQMDILVSSTPKHKRQARTTGGGC